MPYTIKAEPIKRPSQIINNEVSCNTKYYLCPHCLTLYSAKIFVGIDYTADIDRSREGVVVRSNYFCGKCGDYAFEVDEHIATPVINLLKHKINTVSSCSGHANKFDDCSFMYEGGALGIGDTEIAYGPCISMYPDKEDESAFVAAFNKLKKTTTNMILLYPNKDSDLYFFIAPVPDPKDFRRSGDARRAVKLQEAQYRMIEFVDKFCTVFEKEKKRLGIKGGK